MIILPEIQIHDGKLISRSTNADDYVVHANSPQQAARDFEASGAEWMHIVDVEAALRAETDNSSIIKDILQNATIPVQVAGGIRTLNQIIEWFEAGAARVVLGTAAITNQDLLNEACSRYPGGIMVNLATQNNRVMLNGWQTETAYTPKDLVSNLGMTGIAGIIHTDINRFEGDASESLAMSVELSKEISIPLYSSGTIHRLDDIARLRYLPNILGVIVGRALLENVFTLEEALSVAAQRETSPEPETLVPVIKSGIYKGVKAYLSAFSHSQAARWWNGALRDAITANSPYLEISIPQEDLLIDLQELTPREIQAHYENLLNDSDIVVVVLDGIESKAWAGFECGYARAAGKHIIGLKAAVNSGNEQITNLGDMCDDIIVYDPADTPQATLDSLAQELASRVLLFQAQD
jgi:phosphoribosylformimino-5-aminoimidazole carboxamide ribotide isomerase